MVILGMGKDLYENFKVAKDVFENINDSISLNLSKLMFEGSVEELNMTEEQIESSKSMMETFSSPAITSAIGIIAAAFFGFIISAIAGAIMKRTEEDQY